MENVTNIAEARVRKYNETGEFIPLSLDEIFNGLKEDGAVKLLVFAEDSDGEIGIYATHSATVTDNLLDEGLQEWDRLIEGDEDEIPDFASIKDTMD